MVLASQLTTGMTIMMAKKPYRVESAVKVSTNKASPFIKVKFLSLANQEALDKNFRPSQELDEVSLEEHRLEFLYAEGSHHVFLDLGTLDLVRVVRDIIGKKIHFLKEGTEVKGACFGQTFFSVELPQFLELMVSAIEAEEGSRQGGGPKVAVLETGAKVEVPPFVDIGDVIKVDTKTDEYIQRD